MLNMHLIPDRRLEQLQKRLERINVGELISEDLEEYARAVETGAKTLAPKDTGHMASMIRTVKQVGINQTTYEVISTVNAPAPYNIYVAFGTRKMKPRPFLKWGVAYADMLYNPQTQLAKKLTKRLDEYINK